MANAIKGGNIEWKIPLWPNNRLINLEIIGNLLPILLLSESISGKELEIVNTNMNINLSGMFKKRVINNAINKLKARCVLNIILNL